jgi:hypothetical protein
VRRDALFVDHAPDLIVGQRANLRHFVRRPEAIEEMQERQLRLERCRMRDESEIVSFLHRAGTEQPPSGAAHGHDVAVIAEDRQRVRGNRARAHVQDAGQLLTSDLEHVRDHQQQALARGEARRKRAGLDRTVQRPRRAPLALHFDDGRNGAPQVRLPFRRPGVG